MELNLSCLCGEGAWTGSNSGPVTARHLREVAGIQRRRISVRMPVCFTPSRAVQYVTRCLVVIGIASERSRLLRTPFVVALHDKLAVTTYQQRRHIPDRHQGIDSMENLGTIC